MKKLISMTDYVLEQTKECRFKDDCEFAYSVRKYANFLKQPLTLSMFIPTDENGNVLEEPKPIHTYGLEPDDYEYDDNEVIKYQQAKSKVIFEGFRFDFEVSEIVGIINDNYQIWIYKSGIVSINAKTIKTIEDLIPYNLTLTDKI